jgi:hypothetical protein
MAKDPKSPLPLPDEDLGRGGDASSGTPAGTPGEREELGRDTSSAPAAAGPRLPEPSLPPSAKG